jgi:hypothetical protein
MPRSFALSVLITRCKQRADLENSTHITDAEWIALISEQYGDLFSVVASSGLRYFESRATLTTTGVATVAVPTAHYATIRLDWLVNGTTTGERRELEELMSPEEPNWAGRTGSNARAFAISNALIYLYPTPPTGQLYELAYVPQPAALDGATDTATLVDLVTPDGEAFLIYGVMVKALAKSESDVRLAMAEREAARARLLEWATLRAFTQPRRRIVSDFDGGNGGGWDPGDWGNR